MTHNGTDRGLIEGGDSMRDAFLSQPWQGPLLVVIAILLVFAVADWIESKGVTPSKEDKDI